MPIPQPRRPYVVGAVKIPHEQRDIAHAVIVEGDDRGFYDVIGADTPDHDDVFPVGANTTYRVELTDAEADRFRQASNARYVEPDVEVRPCAGPVSIPAASTMRFMRADFPRADVYHGRDVVIGVPDGGVSVATQAYLNVTVVAKQNFATDDPGSAGYNIDHGSQVASCAVPTGGRVVDAVIFNKDRAGFTSWTTAGVKFCADNGAKVINLSAASTVANTVWNDALDYLKARGIHIFVGMGNDNLNQAYYPAALSTTYDNCHSSIAFDENTGQRAAFSNYTATASGCAPGVDVLGLRGTGELITWDGTSASTPIMTRLCAMGMSGGRFTAAQVGAALKAHTRDTGQPAAQQGGGAYDLEAALTALGGFTNLPAQSFRRNLSPNPSAETDVTGYAATTRSGITATVSKSGTIPTPFGTSFVSAFVTGNGSTNTATSDVELSLPSVSVTAGQPYVFSVHSRHGVPAAPGVALSLQWSLRWENSSGSSVGTSVSDKIPLFGTVWARYRFSATAPSGATRAVLWARAFGFTDATRRAWRLDGFQYEQTATLGTYFDGSTAGAAWEGTANNSTSTVGTAAVSGDDYHPVAIVWPASDRWPDDGEYDFVENSRPGDNKAEAYLHYPHAASVPVQQEHATKSGVNLADWHHFAFEKTPDGIKGFIDGVQWFSYAGGAITGTRKNIQDMPSGHLTLQLDNFKGSSGLIPATMEVDWVKVYPVTVPGGGGGTPDPGGGGTPVTGTLADRLRIGFATGLTKTNLGIDFLKNQGPSGKQGVHVDYPLDKLDDATLPPEFAGYCDLRPDAVRLTAYVGGATTPNSTHSRTEFRELALNGVDKASWSSTSGRHYVYCRGAVIRAPKGRPRICLAQAHTPDDDLCMIMYEGGKVFSTFGDTGRPGTLATGVALNTALQWGIELVREGSSTRINYYFNDEVTPKASTTYAGGSGNYFKWGNYQQSSTQYDEVGEMAVVDLYDSEVWHTGYPQPTSRH